MKGFKTMAIAALITVIGSLQQMGIVNLIPADFQGVAVAVIGLVMAGLRMVTTSPVGKEY